MKIDKGLPLLAVGTFGVHANKTPAGFWAIAGEVPEDMRNSRAETEEELIDQFVEWFRQCSPENQRKWIGETRLDVFKKIMERK
jgi:hypothetical protein